MRKSGPRAGFAMVANTWLPRNPTRQRTTKACSVPSGLFRKGDNNNTMEALALAEGAFLALERISNIKSQDASAIGPTDKIEVVFWSDSQWVLTSLGSPEEDWPRSKTMREVLDIINLKVQELHKLGPDVSAQFCWCPEECVESHARADELSKRVRVSGSGTPSKVLALIHGAAYRSTSAPVRLRRMPCAATSVTSSSGAVIAPISTAAEPSIDDPVLMNLLYRAASSSRFFSIVGSVVDCLSSTLRSSMHEAIGEQRAANKKLRWLVQSSLDKRHEHPNLFALIEIAACKLPVDQKTQVLSAIDAQKRANAYLLQYEVVGQFYEFEDQDEVDVVHDPEELRVKEPMEHSMHPWRLDALRVAGERSNITASEDPEAEVEPCDVSMGLDEPEVTNEQKVIEDVTATAWPTDTVKNLADVQAPEVFEEERPSRMRALWNWVGRRFQHL